MALKLFRSTGHQSILMAGETRLAMHPGWMILAVSLWIGFVANVALWRELAGTERTHGFMHIVLLGTAVAGASGAVLSFLGWRKTLKPTAIALLVIAALVASSLWSQALPVDATLLERRLSSLVLPPWASLLRWQVPAALAGLALVPGLWVWHMTLRRLAGPHQLSVNITGLLLGAGTLAASAWLLAYGI